jgi:beta-N-acetylglucosaminidase
MIDRFIKNWILLSFLLLVGFTVVFTGMKDVKAATPSEWQAEYFDNENFNGTPITKSQKELNLDWGSSSPDANIPADYFSVRFKKQIDFEGGVYRLVGEVDDLVKVYIDNKLIYEITSAGHREIDKFVEIPNGNHEVRIEYTEITGGAKLSLDFVKTNEWIGQYYSNVDLKGSPVIKTHEKLNFDWGSNSPDSGIPVNNFSARFEKTLNFEGGVYHLVGKVDDLVKVYIDNKLVYQINRVGNHNIDEFIELPKGNHQVRVEYAEYTGGAKLSLDFVKSNGWIAKYYDNVNLQGSPVIKEHDNLDLDWKHDSPHSTIPVNNFSAKLEKLLNFEGGVYRLAGEVDDRIKVYIDNKLVYEINKAGHHQLDKLVEIPKGNHQVRVEYVELTGGAKLSLDFVKPNGWVAKYYDNVNLQGSPVIKEHDNLNLDWKHNSPHSTIPVNNFSARLEKEFSFVGGEYHLVGQVDDKVKVYIDNKLVYEVNKVGHHQLNKVVEIPSGNHQVRVEYVEYTGAAKLSLDFVKSSGWLAKYYDNVEFQGTPIYDSHKSLNFNWSGESPQSSIPKDNFSAEFEKELDFEGGVYSLVGESDDLVKVYIDNKLVYDINKPGHHKYDKLVEISKGSHQIRVEYVELTGGARVSLDFVKPTGWVAKYYDNVNLQGSPVIMEHSNLNLDWKHGSPYSTIPVNNFSAKLEKMLSFEGGVYRLAGEVDDRIKVYIDNKLVYEINKAGHHQLDKLVEIPKGSHQVRVEYVELTGGAKLSLDFVKPTGWVAKYYDNVNLQGSPVIKEHDNLDLDWEHDSPHSTIPVNNFSAKLEKGLNFEGGVYRLVGQSDDLIKIYIDNRLVYEITDAGNHKFSELIEVAKGNHQIRVEFVELTGGAKLSLDFEKPDGWVAKYYDNVNLQGSPIIKEHGNLNFDWKYDSPHSSIPKSNFSAELEKELNFEGGLYHLIGSVDDLAKVYIDDKLVYEVNEAGSHKVDEYIEIARGSRKVRVEYVEYTGAANLSLDFKKLQGIVKEYLSTRYSISLNDMVNKQIQVNAQIDPGTYDTYIRSDGLVNIKNGVGIVNGKNWRLREGPGTNYWHVATVSSTDKSPYSLRILNEVKGNDGYIWYEVGYYGWQNAKADPLQTRLDPNNYRDRDSFEYLQFLRLSGTTGLDVREVNDTVLSGKGILSNRASAFIQAGKEYNINEAYLLAHALLETGNGSSTLASGVGIIVEGGNPRLAGSNEKPDVYVYNMYGINAKDSCPLECGALYAYEQGWDTPDKAIIGGAYFIAEGYILAGQDTLYEMRWNPKSPGTHQYASDIGWAVKQTRMISNVYSQLNNYKLVFDVPVFN